MTNTANDRDGRPNVGLLLRGWRERRRVSQLELALRADSSARHISFIETGRSSPSRSMVLRLAEHLDVPVRDRNALLVAAGYAPAYPETPMDGAAMAAVRAGLEQVLAAYEPHPALVLDGRYDVVLANRGMGVLLTGVADHLLRPPRNAMRLTLHPDGLAPRILNLREWRSHLLERMRRQLELRDSPALRELHDEVSGYPAPAPAPAPATDPHPDADADASTDADAGSHAGGCATGPTAEATAAGYAVALPIRITVEDQVLSFISTVTTFNTPMDVTVSELAVETLLPADPETAKALARFAERM